MESERKGLIRHQRLAGLRYDVLDIVSTVKAALHVADRTRLARLPRSGRGGVTPNSPAAG